MVRRRRPIVSTEGEMRSKGSVSQAGKVSTASGPRKARRSFATRSASPVVGAATTIGRRELRWARPAMVRARAGSGTASTAEDRPSTDAKPGSSRSSGGRSRSTIEWTKGTDGPGPSVGPARSGGGVGPADHVARLARRLGPVERHVGGEEEVTGVVAVAEGDAHRRAHRHL